MALGAYSVIRYSDNLRDERVNLGVVAWHPTGGFEYRFASSMDRIRAVNPGASTAGVRSQMREVRSRLEAGSALGLGLMDELASWLREGLEFSRPFPARMSSPRETADRMFELLIPPPEPAREVQEKFARRVKSSVLEVARRIAPTAIVEDLGPRWIGGKKIDLGVHTNNGRGDLLWRGISLRKREVEDQVARAKSAALDIYKIGGMSDYTNYTHVVALDAPPEYLTREGFDESKRWLQDTGAEVLEIRQPNELAQCIGDRLVA